ncbi:type IV fimbrial biogenesis protein PilY1 [Methylophaga lonarensis MPL]|uniref:Type IV fimbrial biogenesis protein PilY1 n=1 Tax=Methylophaga lonarensis MPL TaxID=1286106 RepID=M7P488_9GAMM|nr:PilC/PilY family type IV pilus protein [Methylophaga lonarensis]EMR14306.1 type IV fimbrial biogenesis protein PilY1 [Methylophaga lonarensis MPL]
MKTALNRYFAMLVLSVLSASNVASSELDLAQVPLYLTSGVDPNIMFIIDDSGSMFFEVTPDSVAFPESASSYAAYVYPRANNVYGPSDYSHTLLRVAEVTDTDPYAAMTRTHTINTNYYDPSKTYTPWIRADGSLYPNATPACAWHNPENTGTCPSGSGTDGAVNNLARDLTRNNGRWNSNTWQTCTSAGTCTSSSTARTFWPAVYYTHTGGDIWNRNNYTRTEIRSTTATYSGHGRINRTDCTAGVCSYAQEIQNFANWYTYYRSRILASRAGIGRAFAQQGPNMRVGYGTINKGNSTVDGQSNTSTIVRGVRQFTGTGRTNFFNELYTRDIPASGTPLRKALDDAGQYFSRTDSRGPWSDTPGSPDGEDLMCRQSFTILMTDGYWSGGTSFQASTAAARANVDNSVGPVITGPGGQSYQYTPTDPYRDNQNNTLADVAMYYWYRDLRPDLDNLVPTTPQNEAFWQHMVTFGVAFGLTGSVDADDAWAAVSTGTAINWPDTDSNSSVANCPTDICPARLDDLLHASINGRGGFFSAADPDTFATELSGVLSNIADRTSSAASVALNSGTISGSTRVYQARFESGGWTGQLLAYPIQSNGTLGGLEWDAGSLIPAANSRVIISHDGTEGVPFRWSNLSASQQTQLVNENVLNYIRGSQSNEAVNGGTFRNRTRVLGDIINSSPVFSGAPNSRYPDNWGIGAAENAQPYRNFRIAQANRTPLVLVGANDGMLHGFNANTGVEMFSYVPASVYSQLPLLTNPNYSHRYFVDGNPTVVDAFINGQWRTVLVSGLGAGGQGVFALDITDPDSFASEATASNNVLWEFTDLDDRDMGYSFGQPSVVRLNNGSWAVIFTGGYNNTADNGNTGNSTNDSLTGNAVLYIVDLATGDLIRKFDTGVGRAQDPTGNNRPNGLASPAVVDINGSSSADAVYAGDLFGNVWKINLASSDPTSWNFAYNSGGNPQPLFTACHGVSCNSGNSQPITTRPQVVRHPSGAGYLVLFGTGQYMEVGDNAISGQTTQSFYAIWDKAQSTLTPFNRSNLLQQEIMFEISQANGDFRITSDTSIDWNSQNGWFLDLQYGAENFGERQVSNALVRSNRIIFTTLMPSEDPCQFGGSGWLMELDIFSGARLPFSPFDLNDDGIFDINDFINVGDITGDGNDDYLPASGRKSTVGIIPTPSIVNDTGGQREFKFLSGSSGEIEVITENPGPGETGRQSWYPLDFIFQ